jgi:non-ribosomal peptide synthetase component F
MTLLAAFKALLYRYSGQEDIIVGTAIVNRNSTDLERLIGLFINTLPLRTDLSGDPTFRELLARVRLTALGAYMNQDVPFEKLVDELQPERALNRWPFFRASFVLQNAPMPVIQLRGLTLEQFVIEGTMAKNDLSLSMAETEQGLIGSLEYNADLFDDAAVKSMLARFQILFENIVKKPDQPLSSLRLLTDVESEGQGPLDFPDLQLSQMDFENILMEIGASSNMETA